MKRAVGVISAIVIVLLLVFGLEYGSILWNKFFEPKKENVRREVFENTKSFTEGKLQDLASYYKQYSEAKNDTDKIIIQNVVQSQYSDFDATKINNNALKTFLLNMRGY